MTKEAEPTYRKSVEFLQRWNPSGPWVVTAIDPEKRAIDTETFTADAYDELQAWLRLHGRSRNIYFTVNPVTRAIKSKPTREHIAALSWLHVDLDPREYPRGEAFQRLAVDEQQRVLNEHLDLERIRIRGLLRDPSGLGIPKPTCITFSGGGYQGFWRLKVPVLLDGTEAAYEDAKRYNKQLELLLGGDNCHNVDRIMRLPGTVNRPDARKRAKGRVKALAEVIEWSDEVHDVKGFTKAPVTQGTAAPGFSGGTVKVSGNIPRLSSVDDLPRAVSDKAKVVICQGLDPDEPQKFGTSRSEWLFFACCEMVRGGCTDDVIYSVITDPDFPISSSVLDKGSGIESYAVRQIERAREECEEPMLRELNDRHAVIGSIGAKGMCRILSEEPDPIMGRPNIAYQNQSDFLLRYCNRTVDVVVGSGGKIMQKRAGQWWLDHPLRRYYDTVVFAPGKSTPGCYNLWKGFACDARPDGSCVKYLAHVKENICGKNEKLYEYVLNWMAAAVQNPAQPGGVALVLRGEQGTGKGKFAIHFGSLFGRHFLHLVDSRLLLGSFNAHMRDCIVLFADEAVTASDKREEGLLKSLVTERTVMSHAKGVDAEAAPNYVHMIMASNHDWVVPAGPHERRFVVIDVGSGQRQVSKYFIELDAEMEAGGREALLHLLLTRDISEFNPFTIPRTSALRDQQEYSMSAEDDWWYDKLQSGELIPGEGWPSTVYCSHLLWNFREELRNSRTFGPTSAHRLFKYLTKATSGLVKKVQLDPGQPVDVICADGIARESRRPYAFEWPTLAECRDAWAARGGPAEWQTFVQKTAPYVDAGPGDGKVFG